MEMSANSILHVLTLFSGNKNIGCIKTACSNVLNAPVKISRACSANVFNSSTAYAVIMK
ncbi:hypothetical protein [Edwardsiella piscicida]|uniref:hypothetical protein n=1 Tax=Edwardsiella piscicida TaxID=1263550 RepID=UPI002A691B23|nr:hypothetical protein [Edwardsiella piscicida]EKS7815079.1 hypothetical protein [Edwardsiella piscicida]